MDCICEVLARKIELFCVCLHYCIHLKFDVVYDLWDFRKGRSTLYLIHGHMRSGWDALIGSNQSRKCSTGVNSTSGRWWALVMHS